MAILLIFVYMFPELFYTADDTFVRATLLYPNKYYNIFRTEFHRPPLELLCDWRRCHCTLDREGCDRLTSRTCNPRVLWQGDTRVCKRAVS
jgi:hypothetical protein